MPRSSSVKEPRGPKFIQFFPHVIQTITELGGSATNGEIRQSIAERLNLSERELSEVSEKGTPIFAGMVHWAV